MSRKRVALVFVPLLAGAAIVGAGFSTWYFTQSSDTISDRFQTNIEDARLPGGVFSFASDTTINFDQDEITYEGEGAAFVGFGYVQHAEKDEIDVSFKKPGTQEEGVLASWGYQKGETFTPSTDYTPYLNDVKLEATDVGYFAFDDNRAGYENLAYEVHYVVFTTGENSDQALNTAFRNALLGAEFTTIDGETKTLSGVFNDFALPDFVVTNDLPLPAYNTNFDVHDYDQYKVFREKVESGLTLQFSTFADVTSPEATL